MASVLDLGLIGSAWHDSYDVFGDPLTPSDEERRAIKETCEELGPPIRSAVCIALGLVDFVPAVRRFTLDRCRAYIDQQAYFGGRDTGFTGTVSVELERVPELGARKETASPVPST